MTHKAKPKNDGHDSERLAIALAKRARKRMIRLVNKANGGWK